ncbi:MAG: DUF2813 domain-containing protein [Succinivibrionaceae bacterium]
MILERISINGYLGIRHLTFNVGPVNAIIGENGWGRSSLFNILEKVFGDDDVPCRFSANEFYIDEDTGNFLDHMEFEFVFRERKYGQLKRSPTLQQFKRYWIREDDDFNHIHYRITASRRGGKVSVRHFFADDKGNPLRTHKKIIRKFIYMNPVFRIRDSRINRDQDSAANIRYANEWERKVSNLAAQLADSDELIGMDKSCLHEGLDALNYIVSSYVPEVRDSKPMKYRTAREIASQPITLRGMGSLKSLLSGSESSAMKLIMVLFQDAIMMARGSRTLPRINFPILIMSDLESRLHPSFLMIFMAILDRISFQKIFTTNSGDLLSCLALSDIRRMIRNSHGEVKSYSLNENRFSADDLRRLASHVRLTRPVSVFARCWLLVEGETEIWLMLQLASIAGFNLQAEGIRIIEFAQCGANPLIKLAQQLGINWHLLCDGDDAGVRYVKLAQNMLLPGQMSRDHITKLNDVDIEHFLYNNGFESVYRMESGYGFAQNVTANKIIERAIHRRSKPGLAINIIEKADRLGPEGIPEKLMNLFKTLVMLCSDNEM